MFKRFNNSIARRMTVAVLLFTLILAVLSGIVLNVWYRHDAMDKIERDLSHVSATSVPIISHSLWLMDMQQLKVQLDSLLNVPNITYAKIQSNGKVLLSSGVANDEMVMNREFPLNFVYEGKALSLGTLQLQLSFKELYGNFMTALLLRLLFQIAQIAIVAFFMLYLFKCIVTRRMEAIEKGIGELDAGNISAIKPLERPLFFKSDDELDKLVRKINCMLEKIEDGIHQRELAEEAVMNMNNKLEERVKERTAELERMNRELESFCYAISHEFRAPIARLEGFTSVLQEVARDDADSSITHCSVRIEAAAKRLRTVIDSLLTMNRLSRASLNLKRVNLAEIARKIVSELTENAGGRNLHISIPDELHATVDSHLMEICLRNLLGNAIKYSSTMPEPAIEFGKKWGDVGCVYFVRDNGVGFDMEYAKNIFEPFCRLHHENEFEGTGVGLATVQRVIEKHNGRIWSEAEPDKGATFYFTLGG